MVADDRVLGADVEVQECRRRALALLGAEQIDVAGRLLLGVADGTEVAEVLDPDRGLLDAVVRVGRQVVGDLLVQAALEAVVRAVAEEPQATRF